MAANAPTGAPQRGYMWAAFGSSANQRAAIVTLLVAAGVGIASNLPLESGFEIDLRSAEFGPRSPVRLWGFGEPAPTGRRVFALAQGEGIGAREARIDLPRSLPDGFVLLLEGRAASGTPEMRFAVEVAGRSYPVRFTSTWAAQRVEVAASGGANELVLRSDRPGSSAILRRVMVQ